MKIVGRRFWTWMSVWVFSLFWKGETSARLQEKADPQQSIESTHKEHKVPSLHPGGANVEGRAIQKGREHKIHQHVVDKTTAGVTADFIHKKNTSTPAPKITTMDAASKDAAKTRKSITLKQK